MARIAIICGDNGWSKGFVTDSPDLVVYSVDDNAPDDRVYLAGPSVGRVSIAEFDALIAGEVHQLGDKPIVEQAVVAMLARGDDGKPQLSVVGDGEKP